MTAINLKISTTLTVVASTGTIIGPNPNVALLESYEGQIFEFTGTQIDFVVSTATVFSFEPNTTSSAQTIIFQNQGTKVVEISTVTVSSEGVTPFYTLSTSTPISLTTGSSGTIVLYYTAEEEGIYFNEITFVLTDADDYTLYTEQQVGKLFVFDYTPTSIINTLTSVGGYIDSDIVFTGAGQPITIFTATISGTSTYTIVDYGFNTEEANLTIRFDGINFPIGAFTTSTGTLSVIANTDSVNIPLSTTVNLSTLTNQSLASWLGPVAYDNAVIGISYDIIDGIRIITIGVGSGGDSSPEIINNGISYINMIDLGLRGGNIITPYINWREVYRIPITSEQTYYLSEDYIVKSANQDDITENYGYWFGSSLGAGSMFIIEHDGYYNVSIKLNSIREYKGDESFDRTLANLQRGFNYYSTIDRISNLAGPVFDNQTYYFVGFNLDGSINTSLVDYS